MAAPAGMVTNVGKMTLVGVVAAGSLTTGVHVIDRAFGHKGRPTERFTHVQRTDYGDVRWTDTGTRAKSDGWRTFAEITDTTLMLAGGGAALVGAGVGAAHMSEAAKALGETHTKAAIRAGRMRASSEVLIGLGIGAIIAAGGAAILGEKFN